MRGLLVTGLETFLQQLLVGTINGSIIALIALGYTMVYGILELINFAHGDVFMLGGFFALTIIGLLGLDPSKSGGGQIFLGLCLIFVLVPLFTAILNYSIDRLAYKPLRNAPKLAPLVSAIGVSFILMNLGLFWGGIPMDVFGGGVAPQTQKHVPALIPQSNIIEGLGTQIRFTTKDLMVLVITIPVLIGLTLFVKYTRLGKAMRATAQNPIAAQLMGVDVNKVIGVTFIIGGALAGIASVTNSLYNNTVFFQIGYRAGMDAFTAAVLGGIGNLPGATLGGLLIGVIRAMSDQYIATQWTNTVVFAILIMVLIFRPSGLLGARVREKV